MAVELEWRFDDEGPNRTPQREQRPRRARWRVWLGLSAAVALAVGVGGTTWWRARRETLATVEAEVQAVAQLELRALAEGDADLYHSLQDDAAPTWREPPKDATALEPLLLPPLPGLATTAVFSVENARVVGDAARVEVVRTAGLPGGEQARFRAVRFYRRGDDGRWLHTSVDRDYAGHIVMFVGERVVISSFAADAGWAKPAAYDLEELAARFCKAVSCRQRAPVTLAFTDTLDAAGRPEGILPAPFLVGAPDNEAAHAAWWDALRALLLDRLVDQGRYSPISPSSTRSSASVVTRAARETNVCRSGLRARSSCTTGPMGSAPAAPGSSAYAPWKAKYAWFSLRM